jgi:hypothetical protein
VKLLKMMLGVRAIKQLPVEFPFEDLLLVIRSYGSIMRLSVILRL